MIEQAAERLKPHLMQTPLLSSDRLDRLLGGRLLIKAETLQPTGSFKVRGALNRIMLLGGDVASKGLLALSSGNHGLAVSWAGRLMGAKRVVILMPDDAPRAKQDGARRIGAEVVHYDRRKVDRAALIAEWRVREGLSFVPAFDDPAVIAGAGTIAREALAQAQVLGHAVDHFVVACSGGGLAAGSVLASRAMSPTTSVWAVEPEAYDDTARSLEQGRRITISPSAPTICDALLSIEPGELTFDMNREGLAGALRGSDDCARLGMAAAFSDFGLVAEPSGALALGAALSGLIDVKRRTTVVVLSGRNVDREIFVAALAAAPSLPSPNNADRDLEINFKNVDGG